MAPNSACHINKVLLTENKQFECCFSITCHTATAVSPGSALSSIYSVDHINGLIFSKFSQTQTLLYH